jgi:hypothetical protein
VRFKLILGYLFVHAFKAHGGLDLNSESRAIVHTENIEKLFSGEGCSLGMKGDHTERRSERPPQVSGKKGVEPTSWSRARGLPPRI